MRSPRLLRRGPLLWVTLSALATLVVGRWMVVRAQLPAERALVVQAAAAQEGSKRQGSSPAAAQQRDAKPGGAKAKQAKAKKQAPAAQPLTPIDLDVGSWPSDRTTTIRIELGRGDERPTPWDGTIRAVGAKIVRLRPWRFATGMSVDAVAGRVQSAK